MNMDILTLFGDSQQHTPIPPRSLYTLQEAPVWLLKCNPVIVLVEKNRSSLNCHVVATREVSELHVQPSHNV